MTIFYNYTTFGNQTQAIRDVVEIRDIGEVLLCRTIENHYHPIYLNRLMFFDIEPKRGDKLD